MPGIDLELPPLMVPTVAQVRPRPLPVAAAGGPAPYVPQSNAGERALDRGSETILRGLANLFDNALDPKTRETRRGDIASAAERADISEENRRAGLPRTQAQLAAAKGKNALSYEQSATEFNLPQMEAEAKAGAAAASDKQSALSGMLAEYEMEDIQALRPLSQEAQKAQLEARRAVSEYQAAKARLDADPGNIQKQRDLEEKEAQLNLRAREAQVKGFELDNQRQAWLMSPEGQAYAAAKTAPKIPAPDVKTVKEAQTDLGLALKAQRALDLIRSPEVQKDLEKRIGFLDRNFRAFTELSPDTRELIQTFSQLANRKLSEQSGASVTDQEYERFLAAVGNLDQLSSNSQIFVDMASRSLEGWVGEYTQLYNANTLIHPMFSEVSPDDIRQMSLVNAAKKYRGGAFPVTVTQTDPQTGVTTTVVQDWSKDPAKIKALRTSEDLSPIRKVYDTGAAAPSAPAGPPTATPTDRSGYLAKGQAWLDRYLNPYLSGKIPSEQYPSGVLETLDQLMKSPDGVPSDVPGLRIRFDRKSNRVIYEAVPDSP